MKVSSIQANEQDLRRNLFIRYANSFMSNPDEQIPQTGNDTISGNEPKSMGIETLTSFSIYPKQVVNGKTIITA